MSALLSCLETAAQDDVILLIEDGVYAATQNQPRELLAITSDVQARGLFTRLADNVKLVDYPGFVSLTTLHNPIVTWC